MLTTLWQGDVNFIKGGFVMLKAWHLPVAPFVKQSKDNLVITLWLAGENQPNA
jgi:hypothetical protein